MKKKDYLRNLIEQEGLLQYIENISCSNRNKEIVIKYAAGMSQTELAREYGVTANRIHAIIFETLQKLKKQNIN